MFDKLPMSHFHLSIMSFGSSHEFASLYMIKSYFVGLFSSIMLHEFIGSHYTHQVYV